jgi:hypothetical protein
MAERLRATTKTLGSLAARLDDEVSALRSRPWWRRMVG